MKKWQEIGLTSVSNFAVTLMAGGVVSALLDNKNIVSSVVIFASGVYMLGYAILHAKSLEEEE